MRVEFSRYNLDEFRTLTGALQMLGSLGLVMGFYFPYLTAASSLGLTCLMILGVGVRLKIKDSFVQATPALFFALLNLYIFIETILQK